MGWRGPLMWVCHARGLPKYYSLHLCSSSLSFLHHLYSFFFFFYSCWHWGSKLRRWQVSLPKREVKTFRWIECKILPTVDGTTSAVMLTQSNMVETAHDGYFFISTLFLYSFWVCSRDFSQNLVIKISQIKRLRWLMMCLFTQLRKPTPGYSQQYDFSVSLKAFTIRNTEFETVTVF